MSRQNSSHQVGADSEGGDLEGGDPEGGDPEGGDPEGTDPEGADPSDPPDPGVFTRVIRSVSGTSASRSGYQRLDVASDDDDVPIKLSSRPSVILPRLVDEEKKLFELVVGGDVDAVCRFLDANPGVKVNSTTFQGSTALHAAVKRRDTAMVRMFLARSDVEPGDCALHAIRDGQVELALMVLDKIKATAPPLEFTGSINSADFPDDVTPLILAAQCGHYELIGILMARGHSIDVPHPPDCACVEVCLNSLRREDGLRESSARLNAYGAMCNPAYICHTSDDPVLTAFTLHKELERWAGKEPEFRAAYHRLALACRHFAVELLDLCRGSPEVQLVLSRRVGCRIPGDIPFPRLMLAVDLNQKEFVAHPHTQQVLEAAWRGDWHEWRLRGDAYKLLSVFPRIAVLPLMAVLCIVAPNLRMVRRWRLPANKMLSWVASYLVFLALVFVQSNTDKRTQLRGPPTTGLEPALMVFVTAHVWSLGRQCALQGPQRFFRGLHNWYDLITQLLFVLTFCFWFIALADVMEHDQRDLPRKYWQAYDATLVAEGLLVGATILAFGRLLLLCQLNYHLGPLQVSLGKMTKDLAKFVVIFLVILAAFAAGLSRLYQAYDGMMVEDTAKGLKTVQASSFVSLAATLRTLFWALFCMSPIESADVVIENLPGGAVNTHSFTESVGYISFAVFELTSVIVILNMLIATMSNTFQKVTDNVDIEWTFGRSEVYLGYMIRTTLPPPLNLVPTYTGVASVVQWFMVLVKPRQGKKASWTLNRCCYVELTDGDADREQEFAALTAQLAQRYFNREPSTS